MPSDGDYPTREEFSLLHRILWWIRVNVVLERSLELSNNFCVEQSQTKN